MSEPFCVVYRDARQGPRGLRLSAIHESLELAILAAFQLSKQNAMLLQVRGVDGTVIEKEQLDKLLGQVAASGI